MKTLADLLAGIGLEPGQPITLDVQHQTLPLIIQDADSFPRQYFDVDAVTLTGGSSPQTPHGIYIDIGAQRG
jgi:hypothetical protein